MELYIIKHENRIKVGRSIDAKKRIKSILSAAGICDIEIYSFIFPQSGAFETYILRLLKQERINGEWFYYNGIAKDFFDFFAHQQSVNELSLRKFMTSYHEKEELYLEQEIKDVFRTIKSRTNQIKINRICQKSSSINGSVKHLTTNAVNMIQKGEICRLDKQTFSFFFDEHYYTWYFLEREFTLVCKLMSKLKIKYKYII